MKAVFVLFDSLCRNAVGCYGSPWVRTPNFDRFAARGVTFDRHFVGSLPCMPARRDLHTGRLNFIHRSWGPLEPFDNSFPQSMWLAGIHSHLVSDHLHYFEDGGATYHNRFHDDKRFDPDFGTMLYDLATDPRQMKPFRDAALERRFHAGIAQELRAHDAPREIYGRYGVSAPEGGSVI